MFAIFASWFGAVIYHRIRRMPVQMTASKARRVVEGILMVMGASTLLFIIYDFDSFYRVFVTEYLFDAVMVVTAGYFAAIILTESFNFFENPRARREDLEVEGRRAFRTTEARRAVDEHNRRESSPLTKLGTDARRVAREALRTDNQDKEDLR